MKEIGTYWNDGHVVYKIIRRSKQDDGIMTYQIRYSTETGFTTEWYFNKELKFDVISSEAEFLLDTIK